MRLPKSASSRRRAPRRSGTRRARRHFDVARIDDIERVTKHDVIAFLTHLAEFIGPDSRFVHQGMTSSDVLDTCLSVQLARAADLLIADVDALLAAIKRRAFEHKITPTIGRSHGIHAEPTTFGLKLAQAYAEFSARARAACRGAQGDRGLRDFRRRRHLRQYRPARRRACREKDSASRVEPVSTQVIPRDRHAAFFATLGVVASSRRTPRHRNPPSAAHRGAGGRGIFLRRAEGLIRHAAQAQSRADREPHRPRAHGARHGDRRRWKTSRCGTSATFRIPRSSG